MAQSGKSWDICDDCLDPLAHDLLSIADRFHRYFDVAKADRAVAEYRQTEPPRTFDVDSLYRKYRIHLAIDWLKFNVSVEYADDFQRTLLDAKKRFSALEFKACQIINGDEAKESTIMVRYPIQRLEERHLEKLRKAFPDHESYPDREELPDDLRAFEVEILDEYEAAGQQIREAGSYLRRVSALVQAKIKKADVGEAVHRNDKDEVKHSTDFRCLDWYGQEFTFTPMQAACLKMLYENWLNGTPVVGEQTILESADSSSDRLRDVFDKGKHPAWGTVIKPAAKGAFQLTKPDKS